MAMTMLYIWAIGAVVTLLTITILLKVWYDPEEFDNEINTSPPSSDE